MDASEKIQDFFSKATKIVNQIRSYGEELSHQKIVEKVLRSLPSKYDQVVVVIEESMDLSDYSVNELMGSLQAHEQRLARVTGKSIEEAFWFKWMQKEFYKIQEDQTITADVDMDVVVAVEMLPKDEEEVN